MLRIFFVLNFLVLIITCSSSNNGVSSNGLNGAENCLNLTYTCGKGSLAQAQLNGTALQLGRGFQEQCGPAQVLDICNGASVATPSANQANPISTQNQADICTAIEFSTAAYLTPCAFSQSYQSSNPSRLANKTVNMVTNDHALVVDLCAGTNFDGSGVCTGKIPMNLQYFTVVDNSNNEQWISVRGTVFKNGMAFDWANAVLDGYAAFSNTTFRVDSKSTGSILVGAGNSVFQNPAFQNILLHSGFLGAAESVLYGLQNANLSKTIPIKITGHSLGAGVAAILTLMLMDQGYTVAALYDFGQPTVTDNLGANTIADYLTTEQPRFTYIRFIQGLDPIPFAAWLVNNKYSHFGAEVRLGLGASYCAAGIGLPGCYTPNQLANNTGFAYLRSSVFLPNVPTGTLGYPEQTVENAATEHSTSMYLYRLKQLGCTGFSNLETTLANTCGALITDDPNSPSPPSCTPTFTCQ